VSGSIKGKDHIASDKGRKFDWKPFYLVQVKVAIDRFTSSEK